MSLVDWGLPLLDGRGLAGKFAAEPGLSTIKVILLTGVTAETEPARNEVRNVAACLAKRSSRSSCSARCASSSPSSAPLKLPPQLVAGAGRPPAACPPRPPRPSGHWRGVSPGFRVLLAEDNEVNQNYARHLLAKFGCQLEVAADGREVLLALGRNRSTRSSWIV